MSRVVLALVAAAGIAIGTTALIAQQDPIAERQELMKEQGRSMYGVLGRIERGQEPYDQAKVDAAFAQLAATAPKIKTLFPEDSKPKDMPTKGYIASEKIWQNKADFDQWADKLEKAIADNRAKVKDPESLKVALEAVNATCNGCHEVYRVRVR